VGDIEFLVVCVIENLIELQKMFWKENWLDSEFTFGSMAQATLVWNNETLI
jgi:hypothetical protein